MAALAVILAGGGWLLRGAVQKPPRAHANSTAATVGTATVVRTDVVARRQTSGTIGYTGSYSVANALPTPVVTALPQPGDVILRGQPVFQANAERIPLLYGAEPAWRPFELGMTDGPDVLELERNLDALGDDPLHQMTVDGHFSAATAEAVRRLQSGMGQLQTGSIGLGEVVFLPGPLRVTALVASLGAPIAPGATVLTGTSTTPVVTVALPVGGPSLPRPGERVLVTLPDGTTTTAGTISQVGRVAVLPGGSDQSGQGPPGNGQPTATLTVIVRLDHPGVAGGLDQAPVGVAISEVEHRNVLAVPITALLARTGGGYAVEAVGPGGGRMISVTTSLFDDSTGLVEVQGAGLAEGMTIEVAAG